MRRYTFDVTARLRGKTYVTVLAENLDAAERSSLKDINKISNCDDRWTLEVTEANRDYTILEPIRIADIANEND